MRFLCSISNPLFFFFWLILNINTSTNVSFNISNFNSINFTKKQACSNGHIESVLLTNGGT